MKGAYPRPDIGVADVTAAQVCDVVGRLISAGSPCLRHLEQAQREASPLQSALVPPVVSVPSHLPVLRPRAGSLVLVGPTRTARSVLYSICLRSSDKAFVACCKNKERQAPREGREAYPDGMRHKQTYARRLAEERYDWRRNAQHLASDHNSACGSPSPPGHPVGPGFIHGVEMRVPRPALGQQWRRVQSRKGQVRGLGYPSEPFRDRAPLLEPSLLSAAAKKLTTGRER